MLQSIRDGVKGWIAWAVIGLIALPFVFMGGLEYFSGGSGRDAMVAKVGGAEIARHELDRAAQQRRQQLREMFGGDLPKDAIDEQTLRREALQGLIDERLLSQFVAEQNLRVSDDEVAHTIRSQQVFQEGDQFSRDRYRTLLSQNGLTPERYEGLVRQDLKIGQFEKVVLDGAFVAPGRVERYVTLDRERRSFEYIEIAAEQFTGEVELADSAVESYYAEHKQEYMAPEAVKLAYLEVREEDLDDSGKVDEMANVAFERPQNLEPAAELVGADVQQSDWITREGGSSGIAKHSQVVEAAFGEDVLEHDYNSDLIEVSGGHYLVVRKIAHRSAEPRPLTEVEPEVREQLRLKRAFELAQQKAGDIVEGLQKGALSLSEAAEQAGAELFSGGGVRRGAVSHPQAVIREAFTLAKGGAAKVNLDEKTVAVLQLDQIKPGDPDALAEGELQRVKSELERFTARHDLQAFVQALRDDVSVKINEQRL